MPERESKYNSIAKTEQTHEKKMNIKEIPFQEQAESLQNQIVIKSFSFKKSSKLATVFLLRELAKQKKKKKKKGKKYKTFFGYIKMPSFFFCLKLGSGYIFSSILYSIWFTTFLVYYNTLISL